MVCSPHSLLCIPYASKAEPVPCAMSFVECLPPHPRPEVLESGDWAPLLWTVQVAPRGGGRPPGGWSAAPTQIPQGGRGSEDHTQGDRGGGWGPTERLPRMEEAGGAAALCPGAQRPTRRASFPRPQEGLELTKWSQTGLCLDFRLQRHKNPSNQHPLTTSSKCIKNCGVFHLTE